MFWPSAKYKYSSLQNYANIKICPNIISKNFQCCHVWLIEIINTVLKAGKVCNKSTVKSMWSLSSLWRQFSENGTWKISPVGSIEIEEHLVVCNTCRDTTKWIISNARMVILRCTINSWLNYCHCLLKYIISRLGRGKVNIAISGYK